MTKSLAQIIYPKAVDWFENGNTILTVKRAFGFGFPDRRPNKVLMNEVLTSLKAIGDLLRKDDEYLIHPVGAYFFEKYPPRNGKPQKLPNNERDAKLCIPGCHTKAGQTTALRLATEDEDILYRVYVRRGVHCGNGMLKASFNHVRAAVDEGIMNPHDAQRMVTPIAEEVRSNTNSISTFLRKRLEHK